MEENRAGIDDGEKLGIDHYLVQPFNAEIVDTKVLEVSLQLAPETLSK
jgi:hypothetical protein